jgi:type II secretory pathway pseudopilin PulG
LADAVERHGDDAIIFSHISFSEKNAGCFPSLRSECPMRAKTIRNAFTVIEIIIVLCCVSILLGLSFSAVQHGRESARDLTCKNRMREIALHLGEHVATRGVFPRNTDRAWTYAVLERVSPAIPAYADNLSVSLISHLRCPSETVVSEDVHDDINYGMNFLIDGVCIESVTDGTSHTLLLGEMGLSFGAKWYDGPAIYSGAIDSNHKAHVNFAYCDGGVRSLRKEVPAYIIESALTPCGGELIIESELSR